MAHMEKEIVVTTYKINRKDEDIGEERATHLLGLQTVNMLKMWVEKKRSAVTYYYTDVYSKKGVIEVENIPLLEHLREVEAVQKKECRKR